MRSLAPRTRAAEAAVSRKARLLIFITTDNLS
jgi:hypothetical protein